MLSEEFRNYFGFKKNNYTEHDYEKMSNYSSIFANEVNKMLSHYIDKQGLKLIVKSSENEGFTETSISNRLATIKYLPDVLKCELVYLTAIDDISIFPNNEPIEVPSLITHNKEVSHFSCVKHTDKNTIKFLSPVELLNRILKYYGSFELEKIGIGKDIEYKLHREFKFIELFDKRELAGTITTIYLEKFDIKIQLTFNLINEKSAEIIKSIKEQCTLENDNFFKKTIEEKLVYIFNETYFDNLMTVYEYIQKFI